MSWHFYCENSVCWLTWIYSDSNYDSIQFFESATWKEKNLEVYGVSRARTSSIMEQPGLSSYLFIIYMFFFRFFLYCISNILLKKIQKLSLLVDVGYIDRTILNRCVFFFLHYLYFLFAAFLALHSHYQEIDQG